MSNAKRTQNTKKINNEVKMPESTICTEGQRSILLKIKSGDYKLVKRDISSSIWKIYREIHRSNGSKLLGRYYCVGCKQIMKSIGCTNSNLRTHKCHVDFMKQSQLSLLNSSTKNQVFNTATKIKCEDEMSETECETNNEVGGVSTPPMDDKHESKNKLDSNKTEIQPKHNSKYVSRRFKWDDDATKMFLQLWASHIEDFRGNRTNTDVHKEMAIEMSQFGLSHIEIKAKIDNMSKRYKKESELSSSSGVPSKWEHFYKLRSLLTGTSPISKNFEQILIKRTDSEDEESNNSFEPEDENLLQEETFDESMLQDEQDTSVEVDETQPEDEIEEQLDMTEQLETNSEQSRAERLLQMEEEKLEIEREKLNIMKSFKRDITAFHKDLIEMLRRKNNKL